MLGHLNAITLHVGPPTYPAPMQQIFDIATIFSFQNIFPYYPPADTILLFFCVGAYGFALLAAHTLPRNVKQYVREQQHNRNDQTKMRNCDIAGVKLN